jgi:hypothetical protein
MKLRSALIAAVALSPVGCQTWSPPWSELSGQRYPTGEIHQNRRIAVIEQVDDQGAFGQYPIKVAPGKHRIVVQGPVVRAGGGYLKTMTLDMEPCKRYYINTQFNNQVDVNYEPVVDYVEPIAGCMLTAAK